MFLKIMKEEKTKKKQTKTKKEVYSSLPVFQSSSLPEFIPSFIFLILISTNPDAVK
jgi:hypothetical protein